MRREDIVGLDKRRVWHPWTAMQQYIDSGDPLVIERAEGARLYDADGRCFIDAGSSWWVATLGHGHPRLVAALTRQAERLAHTSLAGVTHAPAALLGEMLCEAAPPGIARVFYSDNGSTAVEVALKMAHQFWRNQDRPGKRLFVSLEQAFHGETLGASGLCGIASFTQGHAALVRDCLHVPVPLDEAGCAAAADALDRLLAERRDEIAALFLEPRVQGGAGMRIFPAEYLRRARALCDAHEVLLVADEIFAGYGRTGPMWGCDSAGISPDIMCVSKGFSGGMLPMAATLATERVFAAFFGGIDRALLHGHSYCGNPLGAAVAIEVLRVYREEQILEQAAPKAARIAEGFRRLARIPGVRRPRSLGMIGAVDLARTPSYFGATGWRVAERAQQRGVLLRPLGDTVYIAPPLSIADAELDEVLAVLEEAVAAAWGE